MNAPNQFRPFREDDPMNSKNFPFYKSWSWYDADRLGQAFFSDGNIKSMYNPNVFDNIRMFSNANFGNGNKPLYYKYYNLKVAVYTTDNEIELWDKYGKLNLDFDELAIFFYKYIIKAEDPKDDKEMILTKIKLGESLLKQSKFRNEGEAKQFAMNNEFSEIRALELSTKSLVDFLSRKGALFSDDLIKDHKNIELKEVYFLDEKEQILKLEEDKLLETKVSNILYGEKVKIRVTGNQIQVHTPVKVKLIAESQNKNQKFEGIEKMEWTVKFDNNMADTPYFQIPMNWFDESIEEYNYRENPNQSLESEPKAYKTTFKKDTLPKFKIEVSYDTTQKMKNKEEHTLIPNSYRRNYEELLGLFKKDAKNKEKTNNPKENYEGYFIGLNKNLETTVNEFIKYIESFTINTYKDKPYTESQEKKLKMKQLNDRIVKDSALLWQKSTEAFRNFLSSKSYDDRPLYWARLKMQSQLKRMPIFKEDIDFETSQVKKGTPLDELLIIFEEKSRNYTGIDFGFTTGKKILITGYDPFVLNPEKGGNILQSNPSGCVAQYLAANGITGAKVQTMIMPVRYADFDDFKKGKGVVETYIEPWISKVDIIFTVSQGGLFRFDVDRFPCKFRGGFMDNMFWGKEKEGYNSKNFIQISDGKEFYETTLPFDKIVTAHNDSKDLFWKYYNQTFVAMDSTLEHTIKYQNDEIEGIVQISKVDEIEQSTNKTKPIDFSGLNQLQTYNSYYGSGQNYLSNEIFYRVSKLRTEQRHDLKSGHLHIPLIQTLNNNKKDYINYGYRNADKLTENFNPLTEKMIEETKKIILKSIQ